MELEQLAERARAFAETPRAANTERAYKADWSHFTTWCSDRAIDPLECGPETVALYLTALSDSVKYSTLRRKLAAISVKRKLARRYLDSRHPSISEVLAGIRRQLGAERTKKRALMADEVKAIVKKLPKSITGARDRALLLIGFAGAFRRSELVAINFEDLQLSHRGLAITIGKSKTDQDGEGETIGIPRSKKSTCPVAALETWLELADIKSGAIFCSVHLGGQLGPRLSDKDVSRVVKRGVALIGLDPEPYGGHSLRSGFMTSAIEGGAELTQAMKVSRHKSEAVARSYVQAGQLFTNKAQKVLGL